MDRISIDIVIPTFNRSAMAAKLLRSVEAARRPPNIAVNVIVVDNNSSDDTEVAVKAAAAEMSTPVRYVRETRQGISYARNRGAAESRADLVAMIDDDETLDPGWLEVVAREFADPALQFLGGPYIPDWGAVERPDWLSREMGGSVGWIEPSGEPFVYGSSHAFLLGGNAVFRRELLQRMGGYVGDLGRTGKNVQGSEDKDLSDRLVVAGVFGRYAPDLMVKHHIFPDRLTRRYVRNRFFWSAAADGHAARRGDARDPHFLGAPLYLLRRCAVAVFRLARPWWGGPAERFREALRFQELAGRIYGFWRHDPARQYRRNSENAALAGDANV